MRKVLAARDYALILGMPGTGLLGTGQRSDTKQIGYLGRAGCGSD